MRDKSTNKVIHGGITDKIREKYGHEILDVSASLNPYPPQVNCSFQYDDLGNYPDDQYEALKKSIAKTFSRRTEEICVGNGSIELIRVYCNVSRGNTCRIDMPTFGEYAMAAALSRKTIVSYSPTDIRFLCNPNNPTGELLSHSEMLSIINEAEENDSALFVDEAFMDLAETDESVTDIHSDNLFVLRSFTKAFAVPGIRFGFGFGSPELIEQIETARTPWTVNAFAEKYALAAFSHWQELRKSAEYITQERNRYFKELTDMNLAYYPSKVNYITIDFGKPIDSIVPKLLEMGIYVRDCTSFGLPHCIRVAVGNEENNKRVREAIASCLR